MHKRLTCKSNENIIYSWVEDSAPNQLSSKELGMRIVTEKRRSQATGKDYWMAWVDGFEDYYTLADSKSAAVAMLKQAIRDRPDLFGR